MATKVFATVMISLASLLQVSASFNFLYYSGSSGCSSSYGQLTAGTHQIGDCIPMPFYNGNGERWIKINTCDAGTLRWAATQYQDSGCTQSPYSISGYWDQCIYLDMNAGNGNVGDSYVVDCSATLQSLPPPVPAIDTSKNCQCNCCAGYTCTPQYVGSVQASDINTCTSNALCSAAFPQCPGTDYSSEPGMQKNVFVASDATTSNSNTQTNSQQLASLMVWTSSTTCSGSPYDVKVNTSCVSGSQYGESSLSATLVCDSSSQSSNWVATVYEGSNSCSSSAVSKTVSGSGVGCYDLSKFDSSLQASIAVDCSGTITDHAVKSAAAAHGVKTGIAVAAATAIATVVALVRIIVQADWLQHYTPIWIPICLPPFYYNSTPPTT